MTDRLAIRVYRRLLWLYPRPFRDEYGDDMALLLADQLRDEAAPRVWLRVALDLVLTVPAHRMEARMNRPRSSAVPLLFAVIALAGVIVILLAATTLGIVAIGASIALVSGGLAVAAARRSRPVGAPAAITAHWWQFLVGGAVAIGLLSVVTGITGELPDGGWAIAMAVLFASLLSLVAGVLLGLARLGGAGRPTPS